MCIPTAAAAPPPALPCRALASIARRRALPRTTSTREHAAPPAFPTRSGAPNMNSLIALGASTSFAAGAASALVPGFALDPSFLEEPVMLLAFVLLGRSLEARARAAASADLTALARLIPDAARLVLDPGAPPRAAAAAAAAAAGGSGSSSGAEEVMVPTSTVRAGDVVRVLPGERVPVDGLVLSGKASGGWGGTVSAYVACMRMRMCVSVCLCGASPGWGSDAGPRLGPPPLLLSRAATPAPLSPPAAVDESMLTGEARLVGVGEGSCVTGGTLAYEAPLTLRATSTGSASTLAGIGRCGVVWCGA